MPRALNRPLRYRARRPAVFAVLVVLVLLLRLWSATNRPPPAPETLTEGHYRVQRVVDGDTLLLVGGARIRLIGADTPETVKPNHPVEPYGPEASEFTARFIDQAGGQVYLRFDRQRKDRYDRFLAYVFHGERLLNEELIRNGLATARTEFHYSESMKRRFRRAESDARQAQLGIWSTPATTGAAPDQKASEPEIPPS